MGNIKEVPGRFNPSIGTIRHYESDKNTRFYAKCCTCGRMTADDKELPMYRRIDQRMKDQKTGKTINSRYYCGCRGWD